MDLVIEPKLRAERPFPWKDEDWINAVAQKPWEIEKAIQDLGLPSKKITTDLQAAISAVAIRHPNDFAPFGEHEPPSRSAIAAMTAAIVGWIRGIETIKEASIQQAHQIPLCIFNAPNRTGAKTTYRETVGSKQSLGWKVEILGSGYGADVTLEVTQGTEFTASAGAKKMVFAPVEIEISKMGLYKRDEYCGSFLKIELVETSARQANGLRTVTAAEWKRLTSHPAKLDSFNLSGDETDDTQQYSRGYELTGAFETKLGIKAFDLESSLTAKCEAQHKAEVTFELPAGHTYKLWEPATISGFFF